MVSIRPVYLVPLDAVYGPGAAEARKRQGGLGEVFGAWFAKLHLDFDDRQPTDAPSIIVVEHEALDQGGGCPADSATFWERTAHWVREGAVLWVGLQPTAPHPLFRAAFPELGDWRPMLLEKPGSVIRPANVEHPLLNDLPMEVPLDWYCRETWRGLREVGEAEPFSLETHPTERGAMAGLRLGEGWTRLLLCQEDPNLAALAVREVGCGTVIFDQTSAWHHANLDSLMSRLLVRNARKFLNVKYARPESVKGDWSELHGPWTPSFVKRDEVTVDGIPFAIYGNENLVCMAEKPVRWECGVVAREIALLGGIWSWRMGTGGWFVPWHDDGQDFFPGDTPGTLVIEYEDDSFDEVPLRFGHTLFWTPDQAGLGRESAAPFNDPVARQLLDQAMVLRQTGLKDEALSFLLRIRPQAKVVRALRFESSSGKLGIPVFGAVSVRTTQRTACLRPLAGRSNTSSAPLLQLPIDPPDAALLRLRNMLTTSREALECASLRPPTDFQGAHFLARGNPMGERLSMIYACNLKHLQDRVDPVTGLPMLQGTSRFGGYRSSMGAWTLDSREANQENLWSRDHGSAGLQRLLLGGELAVRKGLHHLNAKLLDGNPPHTRRTSRPLPGVDDWSAQTVDGQVIKVSPENDGHGLLMLLHNALLHRCVEAGEEFWDALKTYAEWVCFSMDHPFLGQDRPGLLYTVSECSGYGHCDIFSNFLCYAGLERAVAIARRMGHDEESDRWMKYAKLLKSRILELQVDFDPAQNLRAWHSAPCSQWQSGSEALAPLVALPDYQTYDVECSDPRFLEISRETYQSLMSRPRWWRRTRNFGYDFCYVLQAALLLDDLPRVSKLLQLFSSVVYSDQGPDPWIVGEGVVLEKQERFWRRLMRPGNPIHQSEALKVFRILIGVDDWAENDLLRLMPRIPSEWPEFQALEVPVRPVEGERFMPSISYRIRRAAGRLEMEVECSQNRSLEVRLGPFPCGVRVRTMVNGNPSPSEPVRGGEWCWIKDQTVGPGGRTLHVQAHFE